jgi:hypothetical protein|tara:strand:- start:725 stop:1258 length:534 start_codon:yes stop_codon:yes gene_type:complete
MATILDIGLLQKFEIIFPFLLVLIIVWGILSYTKFLGDNKFLHSLIALILAVLVLMSDAIREVLNKIAPWFVLLILFIFFMLLLAKAGGVTDAEIFTEFSWMKITFVIISFFILIYAVIDVMVWDDDTETQGDVVTGGEVGDSGASGFFATIRHPAVLGLAVILIIASFTISNLTKT